MLDTLTPDTRKAVEQLLNEGRSVGIEAKVVSAMRSCAEQAAIYASNSPEKKVTGAQGCRSWHVWGRAVDLELPSGRYDELGAIAKKLGFVWGGDFSWGKDAGHFEWHPGIRIQDICPDSSDEACRGQVEAFMECKTTCSTEFNENYKARLKEVFVREWVRLNGGDQAVVDYDRKKPLTPPEVLLSIGECVNAMQVKGNIPGVWQHQDDCQCFQDWTVTACFARLYMSSDETTKKAIGLKLAAGESFSQDSRLFACEEGKPSAGCCPTSVWSDRLYLNLNDKQPEVKWSPWAIAGFAAIGVGIVWLMLPKKRTTIAAASAMLPGI